MAGSSANPAKPLSQRAPLRIQKFDTPKSTAIPKKEQDKLAASLISKGKSAGANKPKAKESSPELTEEEYETDEEMKKAMLDVMQFSRFKSTKNMKVPGNHAGYVRKAKTLKYRQYMNRSGGFNRALSPGADGSKE